MVPTLTRYETFRLKPVGWRMEITLPRSASVAGRIWRWPQRRSFAVRRRVWKLQTEQNMNGLKIVRETQLPLSLD